MIIGIFDSGIGGEAIAAHLRQQFPRAEVHVVNDHDHMPYGSKKPDEIIRLVDAAIQPLLDKKCDTIVIACNTATTIALPRIRAQYPRQHFIGIEPMVKPAAAATKSGTVCVCATPATLASRRYQELVANYASDITIITPDCSRWAEMIEHDNIDYEHVRATLQPALRTDTDVIVLACTHYHHIKSYIESLAGESISVIEPSDAIAQLIATLE